MLSHSSPRLTRRDNRLLSGPLTSRLLLSSFSSSWTSLALVAFFISLYAVGGKVYTPFLSLND